MTRLTEPTKSTRDFLVKREQIANAMRASLKAKGVTVRKRTHSPAFERGVAADVRRQA